MAVGGRGGTELVQQGPGHDRALILAQQVLEIPGPPAQPSGLFARTGAVTLISTGVACRHYVRRATPDLVPAPRAGPGRRRACGRAPQRLGDVLRQFLAGASCRARGEGRVGQQLVQRLAQRRVAVAVERGQGGVAPMSDELVQLRPSVVDHRAHDHLRRQDLVLSTQLFDRRLVSFSSRAGGRARPLDEDRPGYLPVEDAGEARRRVERTGGRRPASERPPSGDRRAPCARPCRRLVWRGAPAAPLRQLCGVTRRRGRPLRTWCGGWKAQVCSLQW